MRAAIVTDIHGNLAVLQTVQADLQACAPDVVLHGGDLADGGGESGGSCGSDPGVGVARCDGSVGLPYDGDPRAWNLLVEDGRAEVRRVLE
ncbi:MAG: metallophosphoesterase [Bryobacteraceae bacterium]